MRSLLCSSLFAVLLAAAPLAAASPAVGEKAPDFTLTSATGKPVKLSELYAKSPLALVVLRGYPGYQCPYCQRQVQDYIQQADAFASAGVQVVFVYPGPPDNLDVRATEALANKNFPASFHMLLDPGYTLANLYGLRWDAPQETAYPATFLLDQRGVVFYSQVARLHGGRTSAATVLTHFKEILPRQ